MNITRFFLICEDAETENCEFDCIYKNDSNAVCFNSEHKLGEIFIILAKIRGDILTYDLIKYKFENVQKAVEAFKQELDVLESASDRGSRETET